MKKLSDLEAGPFLRRRGALAPMPGLTHDTGSIQIEADLCAVKHPIFPPCSGSGEITGQVLFGDKLLAQLAPEVKILWLAYAVRRSVTYDGWEFCSETSLLPGEAGFAVHWTVTNRSTKTRALPFGLLLSGRGRNSGAEGYAWSVPEVPTDVAQMRGRIGLDIAVEPGPDTASLHFKSRHESAHTIQGVSAGGKCDPDEGRVQWNLRLGSGKSWQGHYLAVFGESKSAVVALYQKWSGCIEGIKPAMQAWWEELWESAFTPRNAHFSGSLPVLNSANDALEKLYYTGVLTLLCQRRRYRSSMLQTAYLTIGQRRGEGSIYLSWDLPYTAPALARLDPVALFEHWQALCGVPLFGHMVLNLFDRQHISFPCVGDPYARVSPLVELRRQNALPNLANRVISRSGKPVRSFRKNGEAVYGEEISTEITAEAAFLEAVTAHRKFSLRKSKLVDFGDRGNYLECSTTYAHGTAGPTAVQAWALTSADALLGQKIAKPGEFQALVRAVTGLYRKGEGFFDCLHHDGRRKPARNLYDIGLTLNTIGDQLPHQMVREIDRFVRRDLATPTWARCIASYDADTASGSRCDHQWAGCFPAWPGQYILGLHRAGHRPAWVADWIGGIANLTAQGPFAQAYFCEDVVEPELGGAMKAFDDLPQGNHWIVSSGAIYTEVILKALLGVDPECPDKLNPWPGVGKEHRLT